MVRKMNIIRMVHLIIVDSIELIWSSFEFFPFCVDPMNHSTKDGLFDLIGTCYPLRGRLVMKFISFLVIEIGLSKKIFPSWYLLTRNLEASSFKFPKLAMIGALR